MLTTRLPRWRSALFCALFVPACLVFSRSFAAAQAAASAAVPTAASQETAPAEYDRAVELAFKEFELGNYAEARARFLEAHKLYPNARTHRALGMVEYELKNYGDAIEHLEQALSYPVKPLEGQQRADTEELLRQAKGYVARVSLELKPDMATVLVDGTPVQIAPGGTLLLQVGDHYLEFRAPGRVAQTRRLKINGGEETRIAVVLAPPANPNAARGSEARPLRKNPWLWTAVGIVVAGAAVGTLMALQKDPKERTVSGSSEINGGVVQTLWVAP